MCRRNQHYFCHGCITEHLRRNSHTCPTCADELSVETLTEVPRIVKDYLNELSIRCDYYDRGCRELVQLQNLKRHLAECGFAPVACGNEGCGETISKRDLTHHESELCQFRKLKCHNCGEISTMIGGHGNGNRKPELENGEHQHESDGYENENGKQQHESGGYGNEIGKHQHESGGYENEIGQYEHGNDGYENKIGKHQHESSRHRHENDKHGNKTGKHGSKNGS